MTDGPDVRALSYLLSVGANSPRPVRCTGCAFARPYHPTGRRVLCDLVGGGRPVDPGEPQCTPGHWAKRGRVELAALTADSTTFAALARDAREESSMYNRGKAEGATAERGACARAVCGRCAAGDPAVLHHGVWCHRSLTHGARVVGPCKADAIRRRAVEDGR